MSSTHGFDDEGRQFDKGGNLKDWWTKDDEQKFTARAECMVKHTTPSRPCPAFTSTGQANAKS
jgi:predicted metalloendopeptidase